MNWLPLMREIAAKYGFQAVVVIIVLIAALYMLGIDVREWVQ